MVKTVGAGAGIDWLKGGWKAFTGNAGVMIGIALVTFVIAVVLAFIPYLGALLIPVLTTFVLAGVLKGVRRQASGEALEFGDMFSAFSDQDRMVHLAIVAVVPVLSALINQIIGGNIVGMFVGFLISLASSALTYFAVPLVMFRQQDAIGALKWSLNGVLANIPAVIVFWIISMVLVILGAIPLLLGLLVVFPVLVCAAYEAYAEVFGDIELDPSNSAAPPAAPPPPPVA